jgi:hypothetical protein
MPLHPYQERACECLHKARRAVTEEDRSTWRKLALCWLRLSAHAVKSRQHQEKRPDRRAISEEQPMNPSEEFLRHAADCEQMAKFTRDPQSRATWRRMAERWLSCAERFKNESLAAQKAPPRRPRRAPAGAESLQY